MSSSFRLRYFLGQIPTAQKIDKDWTELFLKRNELQLIESSKELARYNELQQLVQNEDFKNKKHEIINLKFKGSPENLVLTELSGLEKSKPIKNYFKFIQSPEFNRINKILVSSDLARYLELKKIIESPEFINRKNEVESLRFKGSPEYVKRQEFNALQKKSDLKHYYSAIETEEYLTFIELDSYEKNRIKEEMKREKDPKVIIYHNFIKSRDYKNLKKIEKLGLVTELENLKQEINSNVFLEREAFLKNRDRFKSTPDYAAYEEFSLISKKYGIGQPKSFISTFRTKNKEITKSSDYPRYLELKKIVESSDFLKRKKDTESLRYKGSPEYIKRREYNALQRNPRLEQYLITIASDKYRIFLELDPQERMKQLEDIQRKKDPKVTMYYKFLKSGDYKNLILVEKLGLPSRYELLKREVNTQLFLEREAFLKNRGRFETTPDYPLFNEFRGLAKSSDIQFYLKWISSPLYTNYLKVDTSKELYRLRELRLKIKEEPFKKQVVFLKDRRRYESTPEYKLETELKELENSKMIKTYHRLKECPELKFFDHWDIVLEENFSDHQLTSKLWETENYWGSKMAGCSFSQANELQAYSGKKNIQIDDKVLSIVSKPEKSEGKVWDPSIGLIPKKFDYSSAVLNTGNSFRFKEGIVEAKVKFRAEGAITSAFSLTGNHPFPQIDVFRSGHKRVGVGIIDQQGTGGTKKLIQIKGLNFSNFHIFRLEIFGSSLVWKINNHEVHREVFKHNLGELFLNFTGSLHKPLKEELLPHRFEIDWVRCIKRK